MKLIKLLGKLLALPFKVVIFFTVLGLLPLKIINNWLSGYGKYTKMYWKFSGYAISHALGCIKRKGHPTLKNIMRYSDDLESVLFLNNKKYPQIIHIGKDATEFRGITDIMEVGTRICKED